METSGFFNANLVSGKYDRVYQAESFASYFASFIGNGVFAKAASKLQVKALEKAEMQVQITPGRAWINGYWYTLDEQPLQLAVAVADGTYSRIDAVVLRWDRVTRAISAKVKTGSPAVSPTAPSLQRDTDAYEIQLAAITVGRGVTSITQSAIADTRSDTTRCGWVTGVIDQIDTTGLFAQYDEAFTTWFESIKDQLPPEAPIAITSGDIDKIWGGN